MASVSVATSTVTVVIAALAANVKPDRKAIWFQNFNTTAGFYLRPDVPGVSDNPDADEFFLPPATSATLPTSLIVQNSGGDTTLANRAWNAFQTSGSSLNIKCGIW